MQSSAKKLNTKFSYMDYLSWNDDNERWEIINGVAYDMSPAPTRKHQDIFRNLFKDLAIAIRTASVCPIFPPPLTLTVMSHFSILGWSMTSNTS